MLGKILLTFITVLVGVNLVPSIANTTYSVTCLQNGSAGVCLAGNNVTGVNATLMNLVPLFFILGVAIAVISSTLEILGKMDF